MSSPRIDWCVIVVYKIHSGKGGQWRRRRGLDVEGSRLFLQHLFFLISRRDRQTVG